MHPGQNEDEWELKRPSSQTIEPCITHYKANETGFQDCKQKSDY
jgi:hypothetical protein